MWTKAQCEPEMERTPQVQVGYSRDDSILGLPTNVVLQNGQEGR